MGASFTAFRAMFYLLLPSETYYERLEDVPDYVVKVIQLFLVLQILEYLITLYQGKMLPRFDDTFGSLAAGIISRIPKLFARSIELSTYIWVYENVRIFPRLAWDSPITYWVAFLGVDLCYYWLHRMAHEVNIFWASHQSHHSSEYYNLSTALRQAVLQSFLSWIFYLPLALFIPPPIFVIHAQMNLLYQFWIHTEVISNLGPFEYILNTPSHHRVHHGRNPYCIDKNYAGVFIIWDRLFGTFAAERTSEPIAYGLIQPINTFNPLEIQFGYFMYVFKNALKADGWSNKLSRIWKGPGWQPGLPRLGTNKFPSVRHPVKVYHPNVSALLSTYAFVHFLYVISQYSEVLRYSKNFSIPALFIYTIMLLYTLQTFGAIFDQKNHALSYERIRLVLMLVLPQVPLIKSIFFFQTHFIVQTAFIVSFIATFFITPTAISQDSTTSKSK